MGKEFDLKVKRRTSVEPNSEQQKRIFRPAGFQWDSIHEKIDVCPTVDLHKFYPPE